jgi:hypothetical protein
MFIMHAAVAHVIKITGVAIQDVVAPFNVVCRLATTVTSTRKMFYSIGPDAE